MRCTTEVHAELGAARMRSACDARFSAMAASGLTCRRMTAMRRRIFNLTLPGITRDKITMW
jgi:hypothetical protein